MRGALESGVGFATGYPGTPSSEVTDAFARLAGDYGIPFEYAVNEKIAVELCYAASLAGARSICAMKHLGLMVAGDPMSTIPYMGVEAGMVVVSAGDPSCLTSPNEQDQRHLGRMLHVPVLDPSTPAEALELSRLAFELSERSKLPVLLRITTRVAHCRAPVELGSLRRPKVRGFRRDPSRFIPIPAHARRLRVEVRERLEVARAISEQLFCREGEGRDAVLSAGVPSATTADLLAEQDIGDVVHARLPCVFPLPEQALLQLARDVDRVLVVEELSPFVEDALLALVSLHGVEVEILGKRSGHLPEEFEYVPAVIQGGLHAALGRGEPPKDPVTPEPVPLRPPVLCAACPHRSTFLAARSVFGDDHLAFNDIGCYTLGAAPPLGAGDALICMGAGFSLAAGVARVENKRTIGFMGDGTFFHAGMPPLLDAIKEDADVVAVILDNQVTAMTGFQESPGIDPLVPEDRKVDIAGVARALGARHVETFDPMDLQQAMAAFQRAKDASGTSVLVAESPCPVHMERATGQPVHGGTFAIDPARCSSCGRSGCGMECGHGPRQSTQRNMVRNRSLELERNIDALGVSPCAELCPLGLCIQGYASYIASGDYDLALELVMSRTALPDSVCRICDRPCEAACLRGDDPVAVNDLKHFLMDWAQGQPDYQPSVEDPHGAAVAVVGAGPAGLSAAHELRLRGYEVTLFDREAEPGGLLRTGIPRFRLPLEALERDIQRVLALGVRFEGGRELGVDLSLSDLLGEHDAVFIALGAYRPVELELPGSGPERAESLAFLRGGGEIEGEVVVIGGGNAGMDVARTALRRGADKVTVVELQPELTARFHEVEAAREEGVVMMPGRRSVGLCPEGLVLEGGQVLPCSLVVTAVGQQLQDFGQDLVMDDGCVSVDPNTGRTSHPHLFAAGDMVPGPRTVTQAMAEGQRAAWGIDVQLRGKEAADRRAPPPLSGAWTRLSELQLSGAEALPRGKVVDEASARAEAQRCMLCGSCGICRACVDTFGCPAFVVEAGVIAIDPAICVGCGVCADFCPNGAIFRVEDGAS